MYGVHLPSRDSMVRTVVSWLRSECRGKCRVCMSNGPMMTAIVAGPPQIVSMVLLSSR